MKKKRGLGIGMVCALITVAMVMGCVEQEDVPAAMPTPASVEPSTPTPPIAAERVVVMEWLQLHPYADAEPPDDALDEFMNEFERLGVHPVTVFEGSLIFWSDRHGDEGYIHIAAMDEDRLLQVGINEAAYKELVQKEGGSYFWLEDLFCSRFPTLRSAEDFLAELWMPRFNETASMTNRSTAALPLEKPPFID